MILKYLNDYKSLLWNYEALKINNYSTTHIDLWLLQKHYDYMKY